jgi:hypothetical protein
VAVLGLLFYFIFVGGNRTGDTPVYDTPGTITSSTGQQYANLDARQLIGRWCFGQGYITFHADGSLDDATPGDGSVVRGTWRDNGAGGSQWLVGGLTPVLNFRVAGNSMTLNDMQGQSITYARC